MFLYLFFFYVLERRIRYSHKKSCKNCLKGTRAKWKK